MAFRLSSEHEGIQEYCPKFEVTSSVVTGMVKLLHDAGEELGDGYTVYTA